MKKTLRFLMVAVIAISVTFTSCKKANTDSTDDSAELTTHSDDEARVDNESDAVANNADAFIESYNAFAGRPLTPPVMMPIPCDATAVLDSFPAVNPTERRITITYNGNNCSGTRTRTGVVVLTMPLNTHWADQGAVLTINIQDLKITRLSDNKSITINGTHIITNVTGGRLRDLATLGTIVHTISSPGMTVTFDNGSQRTWYVAKQRTFTYDAGIVITTIGTHTDGSITGIAEWGTNRFGNPFVTSITQPMVIRQDCDFRLVSGQVTHQRLVATVVVTFGLDSAGNPTGCPGSGHYYFKLVWTGANGIVRTFILPY